MKRALIVVLLLSVCAATCAQEQRFYATLTIGGQVKPGHRTELQTWFAAIVQRARDRGLSLAHIDCTVRPVYFPRTRKNPGPRKLRKFEGFAACLVIVQKTLPADICRVHNEMLAFPENVRLKGSIVVQFHTTHPRPTRRK